MTIIAGKPFTQLLSLNILDELRVKGVLVTSHEEEIVEVVADYTIDVDDDFVIGTGTLNISLISLALAQKAVTIKATTGSTLTLIPFGSDPIEGSTELTSLKSVTLVPTSSGWLIV